MLLDFGKISFSPVTSKVKRTLKRTVRLLTFSVKEFANALSTVGIKLVSYSLP